MQPVEPVVLEGRIVRLEPLEERHVSDLAEVIDLETFRWFAAVQPLGTDEAGVLDYVRAMRGLQRTLPFAVILRETGKAIGSSSYLDIRQEHGGLEIGMTWYARHQRGTAVNPECKLLLAQHAFDTLGCERVQLKTDGRNLQSQAAISKLGAKFEGVLRKHMIMMDGFVRDTVMYSITREEWPEVKAGLQRRIDQAAVSAKL